MVNGITPQNIVMKQFSRNPIISKTLSKVKYIEELGEGWDKVIKEHKEHPLKPKLPKINADPSSISVTLFSTKKKFEEEKLEIDVNERQRKAISSLKKGEFMYITHYIQLNNVSDKTARRDLNDLVKKRIFVKEGVTTSLKFKLRSASVRKKHNNI